MLTKTVRPPVPSFGGVPVATQNPPNVYTLFDFIGSQNMGMRAKEDIPPTLGWHQVCLNTTVRKSYELDSERLRFLPSINSV